VGKTGLRPAVSAGIKQQPLCLSAPCASFALVGKAGEINKPFNRPYTLAATCSCCAAPGLRPER